MTDSQPCREALPGYSDLFGEHKNEDDLAVLVCKYPVQQWFCFLCRLQTQLVPLHGDNDESDKVIFAGLLTDDMKKRFEKYISRRRPPSSPRRRRLFCEANTVTKPGGKSVHGRNCSFCELFVPLLQLDMQVCFKHHGSRHSVDLRAVVVHSAAGG